MAKTFYENFSSLPNVEISHHWGGGAAENNDIGKRTVRKYLSFGGVLFKLCTMVVARRSYDVAYLGMAPWAHTAIRDALVAFLAHRLARRTLIHVHGGGLSALVDGTTWRHRVMRRLLKGTEIIAITADTARAAERTKIFSAVMELPNLAQDPGPVSREFDGTLTIACLGNLDPRKGVLDFVDAIERLSKHGIALRATIVGGPTGALSVEQLRQHIAGRGLARSIAVTGRVTEEAKSKILADSNVFLYLSRHDLAPIALIEALAHGCAPIVLRVGGMAEMVGPTLDHNIIDPALTGPEVAARAAEMLVAYASRPACLAADQQKARARFNENYGPERFRQRFLSLIENPRNAPRASAGSTGRQAAEISS